LFSNEHRPLTKPYLVSMNSMVSIRARNASKKLETSTDSDAFAFDDAYCSTCPDIKYQLADIFSYSELHRINSKCKQSWQEAMEVCQCFWLSLLLCI